MATRAPDPSGPTDPALRARVAAWVAELSATELRRAAAELAAASAVLGRAADPDPMARPQVARRLAAEPGPSDDHARVPDLFGPDAGLTARAAALAAREAEVAAAARAVAEREQRLEQTQAQLAAAPRGAAPEPAWAVPAGPAAAQLRALQVDTGDDVATVARGVGVEAEWAAAVLSGEIATVDVVHVQALCEGLHCTPYDLFGADAARSIDHAYGPELWPRYIEPLEPVGPPPQPSGTAQAAPAPEDSDVSVAAVAAELRSRLVASGRDVGELAAELGVERGWVAGLLRGEVASVAAAELTRLGEGLGHGVADPPTPDPRRRGPGPAPRDPSCGPSHERGPLRGRVGGRGPPPDPTASTTCSPRQSSSEASPVAFASWPPRRSRPRSRPPSPTPRPRRPGRARQRRRQGRRGP